jgi:NTP pyrophosphatase (non-canonical NTP hydrolase)
MNEGMSNERPPEQCPNCGAALQIHCGYNRPYRRHGWYVFGVCGSRWHPQHGIGISRLCRVRRDLLDARRERDEARATSERLLVSTKSEALASILCERERQDMKWGEQNHDPFTYLTVLSEEVGELAQAALHARFGGEKAWCVRNEAVHVAAVALAIVECLDRGKWTWERTLPGENAAPVAANGGEDE